MGARYGSWMFYMTGFSEPSDEWIFILGCISTACRSQPRIKFIPYEFSLLGNFDFATIPSRNRPVNIRGELLKLPWVICRISRRQPGWLDFRANSLIFHHRMLRGTCTEISNWNFGNGFPSTDSSKVLQRCRTSRMLALGGARQKHERGIKTAT
jgi:hypothetical protein